MRTPPIVVRTIDRAELQRKLEAHEDFKLVMALGEWAFRAKHIPGSLHFASTADMLAALGKDDDIVLYCSDVRCHASIALYETLIDHGYKNVRRYPGGLFEWESAGLPLEGDWVDDATPPGGAG
jgi:rhodanese-related sulfurtransferase